MRVWETHDHRMLDLFDTIYEMEDGHVHVQHASMTSTS